MDSFSLKNFNFRSCLHISCLILLVSWTVFNFGNETTYYMIDRVKMSTVNRIFVTEDNQQLTFTGIYNIPIMKYYLNNIIFNDLLLNYIDINTPLKNKTKSQIYGRINGFSTITNLRVRQIRNKENICQFPNINTNYICTFSDSDSNPEDKNNFITKNITIPYLTSDQTTEISWWGKNGIYSGAGLTIDLPLNVSETDDIIAVIIDNGFLNHQTKALFVDFTLYNHMKMTHIQTRLFFEFMETGGVYTSYDIQPIHLNRYKERDNMSLNVLEILLLIFIPLNIIYSFYLKYKETENILYALFQVDLLVLSTFFLTIVVLKIILIQQSNMAYNNLVNDKYYSLWILVRINDIIRIITALGATFLWFQTFLIVDTVQRFKWIVDLFWGAVKDVMGFSIVFFTIIISLAHMSFLFFYVSSKDYRSFSITIVTMLKSVFDGLDLDDISESNRYLGPLFFVCFNSIVILVLVNVFIAIIVDTYDRIRTRENIVLDNSQSIRGDIFTCFDKIKKIISRNICCTSESMNGPTIAMKSSSSPKNSDVEISKI